MIRDFFSLAFKNLKSRGIRSWLTLLGIFIGVTAVVSLISLGNGLQLAVASQLGVSANELITVQAGGLSGYGPPGSFVVEPLTKGDAEAIERLGSVENTVARNIKNGQVEYNNVLNFRYIGTIPENKEDINLIYTQLESEAMFGRLLEESDNGKVVLGYNYYDKKENWGGRAIEPGKSILINWDKFEVLGIMKKTGSLIMDNVVLMLESDADKIFGFGDSVDVIIVELKDKDKIIETKEDIEKLLRQRRDVKEGNENFEVSTPESALKSINDILQGVQIFIVIVASISIFIGLIGIVNTMTTSVIERRRDIGIMKSVGARNEHIFLQFFIESSMLGLVGGLVGVFFGVMIGFGGVYALNNWLGTELGLNLDFILISASLVGSFLVGGIAGIVPAMKAARQNPVEALRG